MINDTLAVLGFLVGGAFANEQTTYLTMTSPAFSSHQTIPKVYTCRGKNSSVPLKWTNAPVETETFALIMQDPDAPSGTWYHWVLYNIPPQVKDLPQNIGKLIRKEELGQNSWGRTRYDGPCPPSGTHHYVFNLYALDSYLNLPKNSTASDVLKAIQGHVIQSTSLTGIYGKAEKK